MTFVNALIPVILVVTLGWFLAWRNLPGVDGWRIIERVCYNILFPALIISVLADAPFDSAPIDVAVSLITAQVLLAGIGLFALTWKSLEQPAIGSIIQSNARWNTFVALSISASLFGESGLALTAIAAAAMIPTANVLSVLALTRFGTTDTKRNPFAELLRNPLVIACIIGGVLNITGLGLPGVIGDTFDLIAKPAVTLGLLAAGAGVDFTILKKAGIPTLFWSLVRLLGLPALAVAIAVIAFDVDQMTLTIIAIASATPTATNGYILARQLGGDAPLMANLIAVQTILAALTMPFILWIWGLI